MSHRKRKYRQRSDTHSSQYDQPDNIIRGPQAARTADSLEVGINVDGQGGSRIGDGLLKWERRNGLSRDSERHDVWVDRYDARLLLDALPTLTTDSPTSPTTSRNNEPSPHAQRPDSPGGWSDLPSDSEDTFFLTPSETADLHRTKRLRHLDDLRTARLRALSPDDNDDNNNAENGGGDHDPWGGSDEEPPDETQIELMRRTASHVARATNDAQLRARILAHHGADPRFAFLRGRWARAWVRAQADARREVFAEREVQNAGALGGLTGYGSGAERERGWYRWWGK
ncbi:hypothetical protein BGW80DRAFT_179775 [Lactifluus volemus]|nr:hypothetical protein BGW80DRAFT_179775 [Lactifluus volemus]